MLRYATGWDFSLDDYMKVGERRLNMMRAFNAREGMGRKDDQMPKKFFAALGGTGPTAGASWTREELELNKDRYYKAAGWDPISGNPSKGKLEELGLAWIEI